MVAETLVGVGLAVLAAVGLAVQGLAVRVGTSSRRVSDALAVVFVVNLVVLVPLAAVTHPASAWGQGLDATALAAFATAGVLGSLLGRACYFVGIARLGASRAEPIRALLPLVAVATAVVVLGEPVTPGVVGGVLLLVVGGIVVGTEARASPVTASGRRLRRDLLYPLAAAVLYGVDPVVTKLAFSSGTSVAVGLVARTGAAAAGFGAYLAWRAVRSGRRPSISADRWLVLAGVANTGYLLAYYGALARAPVVIVTPVTSLSTIFVVAGAAGVLQQDERVTPRLVAAATVVVLGATIVALGRG